MPPIFPHFETLTQHHRPVIEAITRKFPPYSDFNFTSLHSWNTEDRMAYALLHGNLVIRFSDYITGEPFYSFIGQQDVDATAATLLAHSASESLPEILKLIPESTANLLSKASFQVTEDPDNFDYILSVDQLKTFSGSRFDKHRNKVNKFTRTHKSDTRLLDLSDPVTQKDLEKLFLKWEEWKGLGHEQTENELKAVSRFFSLEQKENLITIGVFFQDELLGFSMSELLQDGHAILHFEKATPFGFTGIYQYLKQETARILSSHGCQFLNCEQDLGIPGLRTHKMGLCPVMFLRKYRVTRRE